MEYFKLSNGIEMPMAGIGTFMMNPAEAEAAVESALQNFGYIVLQDHMESCVTEEVRSGNTAIMEETIDLIKKLK